MISYWVMINRNLPLVTFFVLLLTMPPVPSFGSEPDAAAKNKRMEMMMERIFNAPSSAKTFYTAQPNAFLVETTGGLKPGKALDVGMGQGRNAIHLARQGWQVTGFDLSPSAIRLARAEAQNAGVSITAVEQSDEQFDFGTERWDLIVLCYVEFRNLMDRIWRALKPGGHVVVEYYHRDTSRYRPLNDSMSFASNELPKLFDKYRILRYEDVAARPDWIFSGDEKHRVVRLLAKKENPHEPKVCYGQGKQYSQGEEICRGRNKLRCEEAGWMHKGSCR